MSSEESFDVGLAIRRFAVTCTEFHPTVAYLAMHGLLAAIQEGSPDLVPAEGTLEKVKEACLAIMAKISPESQ